MPRRLAAALALTASVLGVSACGSSQTPAATVTSVQLGAAMSGSLSLSSGWVIAPSSSMSGMGDMKNMDMSSMAPTSAGYGTLGNAGGKPLTLVAVTTPAAAHAQLHTTTTTGGGTSGQMKALSHLVIPAHGTVQLRPGGTHVMLTGLRGTVAPGSRIALTFVFTNGARLTATVPVLTAANRPAP